MRETSRASEWLDNCESASVTPTLDLTLFFFRNFAASCRTTTAAPSLVSITSARSTSIPVLLPCYKHFPSIRSLARLVFLLFEYTPGILLLLVQLILRLSLSNPHDCAAVSRSLHSSALIPLLFWGWPRDKKLLPTFLSRFFATWFLILPPALTELQLRKSIDPSLRILPTPSPIKQQIIRRHARLEFIPVVRML